MNEAGERVAKYASKAVVACLKYGDESKKCLAAEEKLERAVALTEEAERRHCDPKNLPDWAYTSAGQVAQSAGLGVYVTYRSLFGENGETDSIKCEVSLAESTRKILDDLFKTGSKGKRRTLAEEPATPVALQEGVLYVVDQEGGQLRSAFSRVKKALKKCTDVDLETVVPGCFNGEAPSARSRPPKLPDLEALEIAECISTRTRCGWCQAFNGMDDLTIDCDEWDDGKINGSCAIQEK